MLCKIFQAFELSKHGQAKDVMTEISQKVKVKKIQFCLLSDEKLFLKINCSTNGITFGWQGMECFAQ